MFLNSPLAPGVSPIRAQQISWRVLAIFGAWFAIVALATGVWRNVPVVDDWTYAWTVEHLLRSGSFAVLDWSSAYPVTPALWGGLWSLLLGFSFATLRASTLALGVLGCYGLYLMLRELDTAPRLALIGALSLAVNPIFVFLSSSFMTDVPFTTFTVLALLCYVRAARRAETAWLWWGGLWALAALLTRQVGIITPAAALPLLLHPRLPRAKTVVAIGVTGLGLGLTLLAMRWAFGTTSIMEKWSWNLLARPSSYLAMNAPLFVQIAFSILPALFAGAGAYGIWRRPGFLLGSAIAIGLVLMVGLGALPQPLAPDQTWTLQEIGASQALVGGRIDPSTPAWLSLSLQLLGLLASALVVTAWFGPKGTLRTWSSARAILVTYLAVHLVLTNLLWMYLDRYALAMVPPLVALALAGRHRLSGTPRLAAATLVVFAAVGIAGTRGALLFNQAVRDVWQSLVDAGVPPARIDAGYAWNGWVLYAHPTNLAPGQTPTHDVPWVTSDRRSEYVIAKAPLDGYRVEREYTWRDLPWPTPTRLFVLKRVPDDAVATLSSP